MNKLQCFFTQGELMRKAIFYSFTILVLVFTTLFFFALRLFLVTG